MSACILAIDQGTSNSKALLLDANGRVLALGACAVPIRFPQPGWCEQDPQALLDSVLRAVADCLRGVDGRTVIRAIGIANQRESALVWERTSGQALGPVVSWQCRRTSAHCDALKQQGRAEWIHARTGLPLDPMFSASKMAWLLESLPDGRRRAQAGELCLGTVDSWLLYRLTGCKVHATDVSNASRTQLLDIDRAGRMQWDAELLDAFQIPRAALPDIRPSSGVFGQTACTGLPSGVPIAAMAGDSHAAMFAHGVFTPGVVKATYGTGSSLMTLCTPQLRPSPAHGLARTVAWAIGDQVELALEGNIAMTGGALDWVGRLLGCADPANEVMALAGQTTDAQGVVLVPAFAGLGAPWWDDAARGLVCGLTRGTGASHLARAALESIACQVRDVFEAMQRALDMPLQELLADGGASRFDALMQCQADVLDREVVRNDSVHLAAVGAAWLAGLAVGLWPDRAALARLCGRRQRFAPLMPRARREALYADWQSALARARLVPSPEPAGQI